MKFKFDTTVSKNHLESRTNTTGIAHLSSPAHDLTPENAGIKPPQLKTLVLVHPGSLFGSANSTVGYEIAERCRERIYAQLLNHRGPLIVIDGFLSDEIGEGFNDAIFTGLANAIRTAQDHGLQNDMAAVRAWGCDAGEDPFDGWEHFGNQGEGLEFECQNAAAEYLYQYITTDEIEVTGAWATEDGNGGCVNGVAEILRDGLPDAKVKISETALFEELNSCTDTIIPLFNLEQENRSVDGVNAQT